jgi:hypothetical protein
MRTATTKQVEQSVFGQLSTWSIIIGATKELYKRFDTTIWITLAWLEFAYIIWTKLG